jgi:glutathione S-transferase
MSSQNGVPILWHLKVSHYNEKARWALDYKRVPHARRAMVPGAHRSMAQKLSGGTTFPVLVLDGHAVGDSSAIIAELEERYPEPPLYPSDPLDRRRALELEDFFDEELGPHTRLLFVHHALRDPELILGSFFQDLTPPRRFIARAGFPAIRQRMNTALAIDDESVTVARQKVAAAGERFRAELQPSGYLVGDSFTVADLTIAALTAPFVAPPEFPYPQPQRGHPLITPLLETLAGCGLAGWAHEMYALHRGESAEVM